MTMKPAYAAIRTRDIDALIAALDAGTDPNARDDLTWSLLILAVQENRLDMVDVLLSRGANVHLKSHFGCTALVWAAGRSAVFRRIFLEAGPRAMNFSSRDGWTPLHDLAYIGSAEQMAFALSHPGMDVYIRSRDGRTPLDVSTDFRQALQTYGEQEARWQPLRYTWIKLPMMPTRR
jgi:ankyrin repeat protein